MNKKSLSYTCMIKFFLAFNCFFLQFLNFCIAQNGVIGKWELIFIKENISDTSDIQVNSIIKFDQQEILLLNQDSSYQKQFFSFTRTDAPFQTLNFNVDVNTGDVKAYNEKGRELKLKKRKEFGSFSISKKDSTIVFKPKLKKKYTLCFSHIKDTLELLRSFDNRSYIIKTFERKESDEY